MESMYCRGVTGGYQYPDPETCLAECPPAACLLLHGLGDAPGIGAGPGRVDPRMGGAPT